MKAPKYVKTSDGYIGTLVYVDEIGPVYRFPGGDRYADICELENGSDNRDNCNSNTARPGGNEGRKDKEIFKSKISSLIDEAVQDCILYGRGKARVYKDGVTVDVEAEWEENETDIEITVFENCVIRFQFSETVPEVYR